MRAYKIAILAAGLFSGATFSCPAQKAMMFNNIDQYINRAGVIWIIEAGKPSSTIGGMEDGRGYEAKVVQALAGDTPTRPVEVRVVFRKMDPGERYLFFGFSREASSPQDDTWMDNGYITPMPIPKTFDLAQLQGKSLEDQIRAIFKARSAAINGQDKELAEEKQLIDTGLQGHAQLSTRRIDF